VPKIRAVCFDCFGTTVDLTERRKPYRRFIEGGYDSLSKAMLTNPFSIRELAHKTLDKPTEAMIVDWETDLEAELATIQLRPGIPAMWNAIKRAGLKIAICSNLPFPYAQSVLEVLPDQFDAWVLSHRYGVMKPHKKIYRIVASQLHLPVSQVLFVGSRLEADVSGPIAAGASALPIGEFEASLSSHPSIYAPRYISKFFERLSAVDPA
jgi:HAD superfamily hydrolase (TIGR01549 family)